MAVVDIIFIPLDGNNNNIKKTHGFVRLNLETSRNQKNKLSNEKQNSFVILKSGITLDFNLLFKVN